MHANDPDPIPYRPLPDRLRIRDLPAAERPRERLQYYGASSLSTGELIAIILRVGAAGESDRELLQTVERAHRELGLRRAYFSAFHPIPRSPFADLPAEDPVRELRLYQADFMLRDYGFHYNDLPFDAHGLLPRDKTPKQAWAEQHLLEPVEINQASRSALLKIPGIGPRSVDRLLAVRRESRIRDVSQLRKLGVIVAWAAPYILLDGRRVPQQLSLWS